MTGMIHLKETDPTEAIDPRLEIGRHDVTTHRLLFAGCHPGGRLSCERLKTSKLPNVKDINIETKILNIGYIQQTVTDQKPHSILLPRGKSLELPLTKIKP